MVTTSELRKAFQRIRGSNRQRWKQKLEFAVLTGFTGQMTLTIDSFERHELYTFLVDSDGPEGCCAGCTELPEGWCKSCDENRKAREGRR